MIDDQIKFEHYQMASNFTCPQNTQIKIQFAKIFGLAEIGNSTLF